MMYNDPTHGEMQRAVLPMLVSASFGMLYLSLIDPNCGFRGSRASPSSGRLQNDECWLSERSSLERVKSAFKQNNAEERKHRACP